MVDVDKDNAVAPEAVAEEAKTKEQLLADMKKAMDAGDWKAVSKVSTAIAKTVAVEEKKELEVKQAAVGKLTDKVKAAFDAVAKRLIDSKELDAADGIWYANDFGEALTTCRLLKSQPKPKGGGGGGGGKKVDITTTDLLAKHGHLQMGDSGKTYQQAYDEDTDGNSRYKVRTKLLKVAGL